MSVSENDVMIIGEKIFNTSEDITNEDIYGFNHFNRILIYHILYYK